MNSLKNLITKNKVYTKLQIPFTNHYIIKWNPKSNSDIHKHEGKQCDFRMIFGTLHEVRFEKNNIGTLYQSQQNIKKFRKANPGAEGKVFYDVASGKGVKLVKDVETGDLKFIPADSSDIDTSGDDMPSPNTNPGLFGQKTKPEKDLKEILPDFRDSEFDESFYQ